MGTNKMWKLLVLCCALEFADCFYDKLIGKGHWNVDRTETCPDSDQYEFQMELRKNKLNRTHIVFHGFVDAKEDITEENFGAYVEFEKKVDGGYKLTQVFNEESLFRFMDNFVSENFKALLVNMGAEPHSPLPKGYYKIEDFSFDNGELPKDGLVGTYRVIFYFTRSTLNKEKEKIACFIFHNTFLEDDDDYE